MLNYSDADYIPVYDGNLINWENYGYLKHVTNLTLYSVLRDEAANASYLLPETHMRKILIADLDQIDRLLELVNVHHRQKRGFDALGTVLKYITGTPDHDDFQRLENTEELLINEQDRQININTAVQLQIRNLTQTVNKILAIGKKDKIDTGNLFDLLLARNRAIIADLDNIILSITLAKIGLLNPVILDGKEIDLLPTNEHFTISDIVRIANTKIIQVDKVVYFLIKYPIPKSVCKKLIILPVAHNGKILHLQESIIAECRNHTLAVRNCSETVPSFCKASFSTSCALQLISGNNASCSTTFNNLSPVTEIDDGFIVINDQTVVIEEKYEPPLTVSGTYLVLFDDQVKINDTIFHNRNATVALSPGVPRAAKVNLKEHLEILSIPYLHHTNIKTSTTFVTYNRGLNGTTLLLYLPCFHYAG